MNYQNKTREELIEELEQLNEVKKEFEKTELELEQRTFELDVRLKELQCLFNISKLVDNHDIEFEELIQGIVDLIPSGWQYPEITYSRAVIDHKQYTTFNYRETEWREQCDLAPENKKTGFLEVGYLEATPRIDGGYFLKEERSMLKALGEQIERIIERKRKEDQLKYYATVDTMTGVLNRRTGLAVLEEQMKLIQRKKDILSVCFLDADNLKYVNDTYSHEEGDDLITIITDIIRSSVRRSDTLCRLGGDEFLIILPECTETQAEELWSKIEKKINTFNKNGQKPYLISLSHGCAQFHWEENPLREKLLAAADKKMYEEKSKKKKK